MISRTTFRAYICGVPSWLPLTGRDQGVMVTFLAVVDVPSGMADLVRVALLYLHIVFAVAWVGAVLFGVLVLRPAIARVPMPTRKETMRRLLPVVVRYVPTSAILTIVFGTLLYLYIGEFNVSALLGSRWGQTLFAALLVTLGTFTFGMLVVTGSARRVLTHFEEEACAHGAEVAALQRRFGRGQIVVLVLTLVIIGMMVAATEGL